MRFKSTGSENTGHGRGPRFSSWTCNLTRVIPFTLLLVFMPLGQVRSQALGPIRFEAVEAWITGRVEPQRIWKRAISKVGIAFVVDAPTEEHFRAIGASDEWITMLKRAGVARGAMPRVGAHSVAGIAPTGQTLATRVDRGARARVDGHPLGGVQASRGQSSRLTRAELRPIYFGRQAAMSTYVTIGDLRETGGAVKDSLDTADGTVLLESVALHENAMFGGLVVHYGDFGLMLEGHFQSDLMMLNMGVSYDAFLPIGASGFRALAGITPFLSETRQTIGHLSRGSGDTEGNAIELHNGVVGGDVRTGLAYHFRPGVWLAVEWGYRVATTASRQLNIPGDRTITEELPWSKWSARGAMWRLSLGW